MPQLAVSALMVGMILIALGIPLFRGKVPLNGIYGFRTGKTMSASRIWYEANGYAGKAIVWAGATTVGLSLLLWYLLRSYALTNGEQLFAGVMAEAAPLLVAAAASFRYLRRL